MEPQPRTCRLAAFASVRIGAAHVAARPLLWGGLAGVWLLSSRIDPLADADPATGAIPPGTFARATAAALMPGVGLTLHPGRWEAFSLRGLLAEAALPHVAVA